MRVHARVGRAAAALSAASLLVSGLAATTGSASAATPSTAPLPAAVAASGNVPVPASGLYFGAANNASAGGTLTTAFSGLESKTGHNLGIHRTYQQWNSATISTTVNWDVANGKLPAVSVKPNVKWAALARGDVDADIRAQAQAWKAFGHPVLLTLHHEPENDAVMGTPAEYVAAWRHYVSVFRQQGVTNVSFAWIMMAYTFTNPAKAQSYYPGDDVIDWIAADGYNWAGCRGSKFISFATVFQAFRAWSAPHNKPLFIAEVGSEEQAGNPDAKAQWIKDMLTTAKAWPQLKAISWFNTKLSATACNFPVESSSAALAAWRTVAADPYAAPSSAPLGIAPAVVTGFAFNIAGTSASVYGSIDPNNLPSNVSFQYGTTLGYGSTANLGTKTGDGVQSIQAAFPNLKPGTTYHYRVVASNSSGSVVGADRTFTTVAPAVVVTGFAFNVTGKSASVYGSIDPNGVPANVSFQYGPTSAYGSTVSIGSRSGDGVQSVQAALPNLKEGTTYHYRVVATSAAGTVYGSDRVLTTGVLPKGWTWWADGVRSNAATLHAGVLSDSASTMTIQYGTTTAYGATSAGVSVPAASSTAKTQVRVGNLKRNTVYHYRVVVKNSAGTTYGLDRTFRTSL